MKVIIIEDEPVNAVELENLILSHDPRIEIVATLDTIELSVAQLKQEQPDLIFLDIELADGSAFEIFEEIEITCSIIFTTAYDEYALQAFEQNSIAYLLKPITEAKLQDAFEDLHKMRTAVLKSSEYRSLFENGRKYKENFLVKFGTTLIPLTVEEIAYFVADDNLVYLVNKQHTKYLCTYNLSQLEEILNPTFFFRINRQYILHKQAVVSLKPYLKGQVLINILSQSPLEVVVSRQKTSLLKNWLS